MSQTNEPNTPFHHEIDYAENDPVVNRCLDRASLYKTLGWLQFAVMLIVAFSGMSERSGNSPAILTALIGVSCALAFSAASGNMKSAWIRSLELRIDDLQSPLGGGE